MPTMTGCIETIRRKNFICTLDNPIYLNLRESCELRNHIRKDASITNCNLKLLNFSSGIWHKLRGSNSWLFILPQPEIMTVSCLGMQTSDYDLPLKGLFHLPPNCKGTSPSVQILSSYNGYSGFNSVALNFSISKAISSRFPHSLTLLNLTHVQPISLDQAQLSQFSKSLADIKFNADHILTNHETTRQVSTVAIILYILFAIIALFCLFLFTSWGRYLYHLYMKHRPVPPEEVDNHPLNEI